MFTLFGIMTISPILYSVSAIRSCAQQSIAYANDLTRNIDGTVNDLNLRSQVFSSVQDNDTYTYKQATEQPDRQEFVKAMWK